MPLTQLAKCLTLGIGIDSPSVFSTDSYAVITVNMLLNRFSSATTSLHCTIRPQTLTSTSLQRRARGGVTFSSLRPLRNAGMSTHTGKALELLHTIHTSRYKPSHAPSLRRDGFFSFRGVRGGQSSRASVRWLSSLPSGRGAGAGTTKNSSKGVVGRVQLSNTIHKKQVAAWELPKWVRMYVSVLCLCFSVFLPNSH